VEPVNPTDRPADPPPALLDPATLDRVAVDAAALDVLRRVADHSYVLVGTRDQVSRVDPDTGAATAVARDEADTLHALLDTRLVRLDRARRVTTAGGDRVGHSVVLTRHGHHALHSGDTRGSGDTGGDTGGGSR
jgi:hypothetical protein